MRPETAGRDFAEEAGGHLAILLPPILLLDGAVLVGFCFPAFGLLGSHAFNGVMNVIVSARALLSDGGAAVDELEADDILRSDDNDCCC